MAEASGEKHDELETVRDTIESIWVAIVLAFVLRAFLFEAFVIPTGSMAPRLMGEHWDLTCPGCGYNYAHGKPKEAPGEGRLNPNIRSLPPNAHCPTCRRPYRWGTTAEGSYINSGDRVLVLKYLYRFREPARWDVVVFKNTQDNRENYIKRLVGLPGETLELVHGDVFVSKDPSLQQWEICRKPPKAQEAMWQVIFDNDYRPDPDWVTKRRTPRWARGKGEEHWDLSGYEGRRFAFQGSGEPAELLLEADREAFLPRYGYNSPLQENRGIDHARDVCSDLKLQFTFLPRSRDAEVGLELSSFEHRFRAEVRADGTVRLLHRTTGPRADDWEQWGEARKVEGIEVHRGTRVALTHADFRVTLWVDGEAVLQSTDREYRADYHLLKSRLKRSRGVVPVPEVKITARGGECELWGVLLMRDVYYTSPDLPERDDGPPGDYFRSAPSEELPEDGRSGWGTTGNPITLRKVPGRRDLDEFFVLGDNSPQSLDGRQWVNVAPTLRLYDPKDKTRRQYRMGTVPRYNLIGKAFFVYWPSGFRLPGLPVLPIVPNVGRMRMIR